MGVGMGMGMGMHEHMPMGHGGDHGCMQHGGMQHGGMSHRAVGASHRHGTDAAPRAPAAKSVPAQDAAKP
jgi:hypothetical protein